MSFLSDLANGVTSAIGQNVSTQIDAAKSEAEQIAAAVAVWGVIVTVELAIVIYLLSRKSSKGG